MEMLNDNLQSLSLYEASATCSTIIQYSRHFCTTIKLCCVLSNLCKKGGVIGRRTNWTSRKKHQFHNFFFFIILLNIVTGHNYKWKSKTVFDQMNGWNTDHIKSQIYGIAHKRHCLPLFRILKQILCFFYLCFFRKWKTNILLTLGS